MNAYKRINHFNYFTSIANPHVGMTVDVDITDLRNFCKENNYSFYLTFMHVVALAANRVKEFRQRIFDGKIVEYDECGTSHTEDVGDGTYCYCTLYHNMPFNEYIEYAKRKQAVPNRNPLPSSRKTLFFLKPISSHVKWNKRKIINNKTMPKIL